MCETTTTTIYDKDLEYVNEVQEAFKLKNHSAAIEIIIRRIKQLASNKKNIREELR